MKSYLTWGKPMTSDKAAKYWMTKGFVAAELYEDLQRRYEELKLKVENYDKTKMKQLK